jgi:hypothetical protein
MKLQSATHETNRERSTWGAAFSKENMVMAAGVALAFAFVTACLFMLG